MLATAIYPTLLGREISAASLILWRLCVEGRCVRCERDASARSTSSTPRSARPTTCPIAGSRRRSSSRSRSRSRCCSRARPESGRPRPRRRSRRRSSARLIRLQCYEGLDVSHAVYEWNYPRQLLHIRAAQEGTVSEEELFGPEFLIRRPLLEAIDSDEPVVLLIDEIDRADEEFEAFLLEVLSDFQITIPELGTIRARRKPAVILTSNRTRELHDALKRRALFHWIGHPSIEREVEIVMLRVPGISGAAREGGGRVRSRAARARSREAARRRRDDRLGAGARRARPRGDRRGGRRADARLGAEVPRGHRDGARRDARRPHRRGPRDREPLGAACKAPRSSGTSSPSAGCCGRSGSRSARDASRTPCSGLGAVDLTRQDDVYFTLRQTLVSRHDELELFDRAFVAWFLRGPSRTARSSEADAPLRRSRRARHARVGRGRRRGRIDVRHAARARRVRSRAASREGLRRDDARGVRARAPAHGRDRADAAAPHVAAPLARSRAATGSTCAGSAARRCAPAASRSSSPGSRARPSRGSSSCSATSPARWTRTRGRSSSTSTRSSEPGAGVEAFAFGTRLTRLTPDLATRDPEAALARANEIAVDWGSGTRIGASLGRVQRDLRAASAVARRGRRHRLGRLGARRSRPRRPRDGEARARRVTRSSG